MQLLTRNFVERTLAQLKKNPPPIQTHFYDTKMTGLAFRVTNKSAARGVGSFTLDYKSPRTKAYRRFAIGRWPEWTCEAARAEAGAIRAQIDEGVDPLDKKRGITAGVDGEHTCITIADLARDFLEYANSKKRESSLRNDRLNIKAIIVPELGDKLITQLTRRDVELLHASMKATPYRANRVIQLLRTMYNKAIDWKLAEENPCSEFERYDEPPRQRWLTAEELLALDEALPHNDSGEAIRLLMLTGSRCGEVLSARWQDLDLKRAIWTKPSHATKERKTEHVPLSPQALAIFERLAKKRKSDWVFPAPNDSKTHRLSVRRVWLRALKDIGLAEKYTKPGKRRKEVTRYRPLIRLHDLRHSHASFLVNAGISLPVIGKLLGHCKPETTQRYAHVNDRAERDATEIFGQIFSKKIVKTD